MMSRPWPRLCVSALLCTLLAGSALAARHHTQHAQTGFDGTYAVTIKTTDGKGSCAPSYSGTITIRNFRVTGSSDPTVTASGGIESDGTVSLAFQKDGQFANVGGRLRGPGGHGFWSSPTAFCGGLWEAKRDD